jgi:hypothetical protein
MTVATTAALVALVPAMIGPLPLEQGGQALMIALCGGGEMELAAGRDNGTIPMPASTPCCAKGCRSGDKRRNTIGDN